MAKAGRKEHSLAPYETILKLKDLDECCRFLRICVLPRRCRPWSSALMWLSISSRACLSGHPGENRGQQRHHQRVRRSMLENGAGGVMQDIIIREGLDQPK